MRRLAIVLGDQLNADAALFDDLDPASDALWMAEVPEEATHVWSHRARIALFLAAMRHFRDAREAAGWTVHYRALGAHEARGLADALAADIARLRPEELLVVLPGDHRVLSALQGVAADQGLPLRVLADRHFIDSPDGFREYAEGRKEIRLEYYYRLLRRRTGYLMAGKDPEGGQWNFDAYNRKAFGRQGPGLLPPPVGFPPDAVTQSVIEAVEAHFPDHPGELDAFDWPVTPEQARAALTDFIDHRLPLYGRYQDAMWTDEPWLYHARISAGLNLKLLDPCDALQAAEQAWREGHAPLEAVEGFIRQILGWREYVRGLYWYAMPEYAERNALDAEAALPDWYWTGDVPMTCLQQAIGQTLRYGYAHHIQRLMVTGLYALLLGVRPQAVHEWYLAVYVDAVEWVELPNTLGMAQFGDGGLMASKPYCAAGRYIQRMSNYCGECRFDPGQRTGEQACPFTTLYWDFLRRHRERLAGNRRMGLQLRNLDRLSAEEAGAIRERADRIKAGGGTPPAGA